MADWKDFQMALTKAARSEIQMAETKAETKVDWREIQTALMMVG